MNLQWLGQPTYEQCFREDPNFDGCWRNAFRQAQLECDQTTQGYPNYDACVNGRARNIANQICIPACEAYLRGAGEYPWGVRSQATCEVQRDINAALREQGFNPIAEDCVMGPRTCGASDAVGFGVPASCVPHRSEWIAPTRVGQAPPPPATSAGAKKSRRGLTALVVGAAIAGLAYLSTGG
jgi:hypothetical protein